MIIAFLVYAGVKTVLAGLSAKRVLPMETPKTMGMGGPLFSMVRDLEREIGDRIAYDVDVNKDPLKLNRIIAARGRRGLNKAEIAESLNKLRLSCTIISPTKKTAIIKHKGKSYVLGVGDEISGRQVLSIDKKKVILRYRGQEVVLYNRPAPLAEIKYDTKVRLDKIEL
jgi:hypothetical protein